MSEPTDPTRPFLSEEAKGEILRTLLEQAERAKRIANSAANEISISEQAWRRAVDGYRWWWYPRCPDIGKDWRAWKAFARRRARYARDLYGVALFSAVVALPLPGTGAKWMFLGNAVLLAVIAAWQRDVANGEMQLIEVGFGD